MTLATVFLVLMAAAASAAGASRGGRNVTVCMEMRAGDFGRAKIMAAEMFARIGVALGWHDPTPCPSGALRISFSNRTPVDLRPGALAYALPYEGTHIRLFWDRIQAGAATSLTAALLAHTLAHEITHMLEGCIHHSSTGLMKAHWSPADVDSMEREPLPFTADDVSLIYEGMDRRLAGRTLALDRAQAGIE